MVQTLSAPAITIIQQYLKLAFSNGSVSCPYYNNRRAHKRGGLAVYVGKAKPQDIIDEALAIALQKHIDLVSSTDTDRKKFLVDHGLGVDCSGLAYHVLDAELQATRHTHIYSVLLFKKSINPVRNIIRKLRPSENASVQTFASDANSVSIPLKDSKPGDMVIMLGSGHTHDRDHILIIHAIEQNNSNKIIHYTHSLNWRSDGEYNHGVRQGTITVTNINEPLTSAVWEEQGVQGEQNETLERALYAEAVMIRRLRALG